MVQQQLGQLDGWLLAPAFPHESPIPFIPRGIAQRLWPGGFLRPQPATMVPAPPMVAPVGVPTQPQPAQAPPGLPPPPQPKAVAPPPPPVPVMSIRRPVAERRGM